MKTLLRIVIILAFALAVTGALYAVGQSEWATAQLAGDRPAMAEGGAGGRVVGWEATDSRGQRLAGYAQRRGRARQVGHGTAAATTLGLAEADVQAAVEASLGALRAGGEGGERGGGAFSAAGLATFARILLPMVIVIAAVSGLRGLWERGRRNRQPAPA